LTGDVSRRQKAEDKKERIMMELIKKYRLVIAVILPIFDSWFFSGHRV